MNFLTTRQEPPSAAPDRITVQSHASPDLDSTSTTGTATTTSIITTPNSSGMPNQSPSLYKLIILKNDLQRDDWKDATVSIFDTNEDPTPENHPLLLFQLANYSSAALRFLERVIEQVNNSPLLEGTGCKYCPSAAVRYDTDPHGHHRGVILKLMNIERDFRDYSRERDEPPSYTGSTTQ